MTIILGVVVFTLLVILLVAFILVAKKQLVASGPVKILVNDQKEIEVPAGGKLLTALADAGIFVSSACGGPVRSAASRSVKAVDKSCQLNRNISTNAKPPRASVSVVRSLSNRT